MEVYKRKDIPWRIIDDQALVVNPRTSLIYPLNAVAARIWQLIDSAKGTEKIIDTLKEEFDIDRETLRADALMFISQLREQGLIERIYH